MAARSDPYARWAEATDFGGMPLARGQRIPILVDCHTAAKAVEFSAVLRRKLDCIAYYEEQSRYLTIYVPRDHYERVVEAIRHSEFAWELGLPFASPDAAYQSQKDWMLREEQTGRSFRLNKHKSKKPVIGFIDYGCAFANSKFGEPQGQKWTSRLFALWDQGGDPVESRAMAQASGVRAPRWGTPLEFFYGAQVFREPPAQASAFPGPVLNSAWNYCEQPLRQPDVLYLDAYLQQFYSPESGYLDEESCYRCSGYKAINAFATHGTHIMDVAAGYPDPLGLPDQLDGPRPDHDLVFVQLPRFFKDKHSGADVQVSGLLRTYVLDAVRYIFSCAEDSAPVTINLSYGANAGPHNGDSILERALDEAIRQRRQRGGPTDIVIASGNWFDRDLHAFASIKAGHRKSIVWANVPDNPTDQFVELWLDGKGDTDAQWKVRLTAPGRQPSASDWVGSGQAAYFDGVQWSRARPDSRAPVAMVVFPKRASQSSRGYMVLLAVGPTVAMGKRAASPYGAWSIEIENKGPAKGMVNAWCERDDPVFGSGSGPRQAKFESCVATTYSLNSLGHGRETTIVGGYVENLRAAGGQATAHSRMAAYSCEGPGRGVKAPSTSRYPPASGEEGKPGPDLLGISEEGDELPGIAAAAVYGTDRVRLSGTSVAAAVVTRYLSQRHAAGPVGRKTTPQHTQVAHIARGRFQPWERVEGPVLRSAQPE